MNITVLHNQSLFDVLLQHTGSLASILDVAMANSIGITDNLTPGQDLIIPEAVEVDRDILNYYASRGLQPATAIEHIGAYRPKGISIWTLSDEFIVQ